MSTHDEGVLPDAAALPPLKLTAMKPSALQETDALTTTELANALDNCPTHDLSMYVALAIDRLRALAAATEEKDKVERLWQRTERALAVMEREHRTMRNALIKTTGSLGLIIKGAEAHGQGHQDNYDAAKYILNRVSNREEDEETARK